MQLWDFSIALGLVPDHVVPAPVRHNQELLRRGAIYRLRVRQIARVIGAASTSD